MEINLWLTRLPLYNVRILSYLSCLCQPVNISLMPTRHLRRMTNLLETTDLNVRIAAGESLALMYEMARDFNKDFIGDSNGLCDLLRDLATDGNKHKAKKDLRQQRSSFRDILKTVEVNWWGFCEIYAMQRIC